MTFTRLSTLALGALALLSALPAHPQAAAKPNYSREPSIIERFDVVYTYAAEGTGTKQMEAVIHLQDDAAIKTWSVLSFPFASSSQHVEIDYVRVRRPDGTVIETPSADAQEMPAAITREAPFYSDLKEKQIPVRSLHSGDRIEYKIRIVGTRAEAPGHFWGDHAFFGPANGVVVLEESAELHIPKSSFAQVWSPKLKPVQTDTDTERVYRWQYAQLSPIAGVDKQVLRRLLTPAPGDEDGALPEIAWTNFHDWNEVGTWYRTMEGARTAPDADIRAKATELTAGKSTDDEKIRAIYGYVSSQIRYIGVAFGVGRYQPHEAGEVLRNQYGDCKDKHTLLASLLEAAGFHADAALIGAGIRFNEAVPSPSAFNHVITVVPIDGKPIWLDATTEVAPYRLLLAVLRDKPALVIPPTGAATIETTPKNQPFPSEIHFDAVGTLDDQGTSHSQITIVLRGLEEVVFRTAARTVAPSQWDELMQRISQGMGYSGTVTHAEFSRPDDTATPFRITYDYERIKGGDWDNYRIAPQFTPIALGPVDETDLPILPIELGDLHVEIDHAVMTLPRGWSAELPPATHAKSTFATLDKTYKFENGKIISDRRFEILKRKIPASEWRAYKDWYTEASPSTENWIQLIRSSGHAGSSDAKAAGLLNEANQLGREKDWKGARQKLDEAKAINPRQAYLWSTYGFLAMMNGKTNEAIEDFQKELAEHPEEEKVAALLVETQIREHKPQDAIDTLRKIVSLNPKDAQASYRLASMLFVDKQYPAAETALRNIVTTDPIGDQAKLLLSKTLLHTGKKDEAVNLLKAIMEKSSDPLTLNNAAYVLADENLELPFAEQTARHALTILEDHGADDDNALKNTETFVHIWDTLGWTLFREGKAAEAEPLLRASWANGLSSVTGYHLGMVLEAEHQPIRAMAIYQLALFGEKSSDDSINENNIARQAALRAAGTPRQVEDGKMALQAQRTYKVPGTTTATAWGEAEVEISTDGATHAKLLNDSTDSALAPVVELLTHIDYKLAIPEGSKAKLLRHGVLACHAGKPCEFVLVSTRDALKKPTT